MIFLKYIIKVVYHSQIDKYNILPEGKLFLVNFIN